MLKKKISDHIILVWPNVTAPPKAQKMPRQILKLFFNHKSRKREGVAARGRFLKRERE